MGWPEQAMVALPQDWCRSCFGGSSGKMVVSEWLIFMAVEEEEVARLLAVTGDSEAPCSCDSGRNSCWCWFSFFLYFAAAGAAQSLATAAVVSEEVRRR